MSSNFDLVLYKEIDWETVDIILISTYGAATCLSFITEHTLFSGTILCTFPTAEFGKLAQKELLEYLPNCPFDEFDLSNCMSKVTMIGFSEPRMFGRLRIHGVSNGVCLGGTNWIFEYDSNPRIAFISGFTLNSLYVEPFEFDALKDTTAIVSRSIPRFAKSSNFYSIWPEIEKDLNDKKRIIFVIQAFDKLFKMVQVVSKLLGSKYNDCFHVKNPVAKAAYHFSTIYGEWMSVQARANIFVAKRPILHNINFKFHDTFDTLNNAQIIFCGHYSAKIGDVKDLLEIFPASTVILSSNTSMPIQDSRTKVLHYSEDEDGLVALYSSLQNVKFSTLEQDTKIDIPNPIRTCTFPSQVLHRPTKQPFLDVTETIDTKTMELQYPKKRVKL